MSQAVTQATQKSVQSQAKSQIVLDVRTAAEFAASHVPGAVNIPVQELSARHPELGAKETKLVLYCRSGARSSAAAAELRRLGYKDVPALGPMSAALRVL